MTEQKNCFPPDKKNQLPLDVQEQLRFEFLQNPDQTRRHLTHTEKLIYGVSQRIADDTTLSPEDKQMLQGIIEKGENQNAFLQSLLDLLPQADRQTPQTAPDVSPLDQFRTP